MLFPLLFLSGALYPTGGMPAALRAVARLNPVTYDVDLMRVALGQPSEFSAMRSTVILVATTACACVLTGLIFDPERRVVFRERTKR